MLKKKKKDDAGYSRLQEGSWVLTSARKQSHSSKGKDPRKEAKSKAKTCKGCWKRKNISTRGCVFQGRLHLQLVSIYQTDMETDRPLHAEDSKKSIENNLRKPGFREPI